MKMKRNVLFAMLSIVLVIALVGCSSTTNAPEAEGAEFEEELLTFEELVLRSNVAVVGEYVETIKYDNYIEQRFKVKECLYGDVPDDEIYLYANIGMGYIKEIDYTYELGEDVYTVGADYVLVMEKLQSVMYDHDRYMLSADVFLSEEDNEFSLNSRSIDVPSGKTIKDYICSIYNSVSHPVVANNFTTYKNEIEEMVGESDFVGTVKIVELVNEGKVHNGNTYRCVVESLSKGSNLNTYEDGTILLVILKNTVEVNGSYVIGFSAVDEGSLIYTQTTDTSVHTVSDGLLAEILEYQAGLVVEPSKTDSDIQEMLINESKESIDKPKLVAKNGFGENVDMSKITINILDEEPDYQSVGTVNLREEIFIPMSRNEVLEFFDYSFDLKEAIAGIHDIDGLEYGVYKFPSGSYYTVNNFSYVSNEDAGQTIAVTICQNQLPVVDIVEAYDYELETSEINGVEMLLTQFTSKENEQLTAFAQFMYKGIGFFVSAQNMTTETFLSALDYLSTR